MSERNVVWEEIKDGLKIEVVETPCGYAVIMSNAEDASQVLPTVKRFKVKGDAVEYANICFDY